MKILILCPVCGSDDISRDAVAKWCFETQTWELAGEHDCQTCNSCGYETDWRMRQISLRSGVTWTARDDEAAVADGWTLFRGDGGVNIEPTIDPETERPRFESAEAALERVGLLAVEGLEVARRALALHHGA